MTQEVFQSSRILWRLRSLLIGTSRAGQRQLWGHVYCLYQGRWPRFWRVYLDVSQVWSEQVKKWSSATGLCELLWNQWCNLHSNTFTTSSAQLKLEIVSGNINNQYLNFLLHINWIHHKVQFKWFICSNNVRQQVNNLNQRTRGAVEKPDAELDHCLYRSEPSNSLVTINDIWYLTSKEIILFENLIIQYLLWPSIGLLVIFIHIANLTQKQSALCP